MQCRKTILGFVFGAMLLVSANAFAHYYQVTDNATGKVYYTKDIDQKGGGAIRFKDSNTGDKITLQSTTVEKITKEQYNRESCGCAGNDD